MRPEEGLECLEAYLVLLIISAIWITFRKLSNTGYFEEHDGEVFCRGLPVSHRFLPGKREETSGELSLLGLLEQCISVRVIILLRFYSTKPHQVLVEKGQGNGTELAVR